MAVDPKLLVIKPVDELAEVSGLQEGDLLFYDGTGNLKRISIDTFNNLSKTAKPLKPTDATPTAAGLYMPTQSGTYANAGGLIAQEGYYTLFFFDGTTWTKAEIKLPNNIRLWNDLIPSDFPLNQDDQVIYNNIFYIAPNGAGASDVPGESAVWEIIGSKIELENEIISTDETKAVSGKAVADYIGDFNKSEYSGEEYINLKTIPFTNDFYVNNSGIVTPSTNAKYLSFDIKKGDVIAANITSFQGGASFIFAPNSGANIYKFDFNTNTLIRYNYLFESDGKLYINMQKASPDPAYLDIYRQNYQSSDNVVEYIDNALLISKSTENFQDVDVLHGGGTNVYFDLLNAQIGVTKYDVLSSYSNYVASRLISVQNTDQLLVNMEVGSAGIALFDKNGILLKKLLWSTDGLKPIVNRTIKIENDGFIQVSFDVTKTTNVKIARSEKNLTLQEFYNDFSNNGGGGGSAISLSDTFVFAGNYGVSSDNTATENTVALNNLFSDSRYSAARIILPAGEINYNGTLNISNKTQLEGSSWGSDNFGGTRLVSQSVNAFLNVQRTVSNEYQSGRISNISFDGNNIAPKGLELGEAVVNGNYENLSFKWFTDVCVNIHGALIFSMKNCRFANSPNGTRLRRTPDFQANHIKFDGCQWIILSKIGAEMSGGANIVYDFCDFEHVGTQGDFSSGVMKLRNMTPANESSAVILNSCWSEYVYGEAWLDIADTTGVTVVRDSQLWKLAGDTKYGIKNNGSKVLIDGNSRMFDFAVKDVLTINNGQTRVSGFSNVGTHEENTGGSYKTQVW